MQKKDKPNWKLMMRDVYRMKQEDQPNKQRFTNLNLNVRFQKQEDLKRRQSNQKSNFKECHSIMGNQIKFNQVKSIQAILISSSMDQMLYTEKEINKALKELIKKVLMQECILNFKIMKIIIYQLKKISCQKKQDRLNFSCNS